MNARRLALVAVPLLWGGTLVSAVGAIYCKHESRRLFVELENLTARRDQLQIEWGQLQLEQSAWSTHAFVERVAHSRLGMRIPPATAVRIIKP